MKVLMVCLGNICRSPLAEGILLHKAHENNLELTVDSAGTAAYHIDESPDYRSIQIARKHGINISKQKGRQFRIDDFDQFDKIFVMDHSNLTNVLSLARNEKDKEKVSLILNQLNSGKDLEVPDPYYGGDNGFEEVYKMLSEASDNIIKDLINGN